MKEPMADNRGRRFVLPLVAVLIAAGAIAGSKLVTTGEAEQSGTADASASFGAANPTVSSALSVPVAAMQQESDRTGAEATSEPDRRILVSLEERTLLLVEGADTLLRAPVAIGMGQDFTYHGRRYHFSTPAGERTIRGKARDPLWIPPEWHYYEKAVKLGLDTVVQLPGDARIMLGDSSWLVVQDDQVGRVNHFGYFAPFTPGTEIVFDGVMYIPPSGTAQRRVPDALGPFKLDMGDGYLIHGTHIYNEESIGEAVSHGCVRMRNEDLAELYPLVPVGTTVTIY
jgi:lipoprotein-anchoring transpeptidase ErfK/SrfK